MAGPHQLIRTARRLTRLIGQNIHVCISIGDGMVGEGLHAAPFIGRNLLHSYSFPERAIGNSGNSSDFTIFIRAEMLQPP